MPIPSKWKDKVPQLRQKKRDEDLQKIRALIEGFEKYLSNNYSSWYAMFRRKKKSNFIKIALIYCLFERGYRHVDIARAMRVKAPTISRSIFYFMGKFYVDDARFRKIYKLANEILRSVESFSVAKEIGSEK